MESVRVEVGVGVPLREGERERVGEVVRRLAGKKNGPSWQDRRGSSAGAGGPGLGRARAGPI